MMGLQRLAEEREDRARQYEKLGMYAEAARLRDHAANYRSLHHRSVVRRCLLGHGHG